MKGPDWLPMLGIVIVQFLSVSDGSVKKNLMKTIDLSAVSIYGLLA